MVGGPFTITTNLVPAVRIPVSQGISSIPTPMSSRPRGPMRPLLSNSNPPLPKTHTNSQQIHRQPVYSERQENQGPSVTVFVGSITERAPDVMVRHILNTC